MTMRSISYPAVLGDQEKTVKVVELTGGHGWQIFIDNYYQGVIHLIGGEMVAHLALPIELAGDDIGALMEVIETEFR